jgi:tRNA(fMet)-specific endonuclease VapC
VVRVNTLVTKKGQYIGYPLFGILDCPRASIRKSAEIHAKLSKTGDSLDIKDILVAGTCIYFNLPLLTRNIKHFRRIKELSLVDVDALL